MPKAVKSRDKPGGTFDAACSESGRTVMDMRAQRVHSSVDLLPFGYVW